MSSPAGTKTDAPSCRVFWERRFLESGRRTTEPSRRAYAAACFDTNAMPEPGLHHFNQEKRITDRHCDPKCWEQDRAIQIHVAHSRIPDPVAGMRNVCPTRFSAESTCIRASGWFSDAITVSRRSDRLCMRRHVPNDSSKNPHRHAIADRSDHLFVRAMLMSIWTLMSPAEGIDDLRQQTGGNHPGTDNGECSFTRVVREQRSSSIC